MSSLGAISACTSGQGTPKSFFDVLGVRVLRHEMVSQSASSCRNCCCFLSCESLVDFLVALLACILANFLDCAWPLGCNEIMRDPEGGTKDFVLMVDLMMMRGGMVVVVIGCGYKTVVGDKQCGSHETKSLVDFYKSDFQAEVLRVVARYITSTSENARAIAQVLRISEILRLRYIL